MHILVICHLCNTNMDIKNNLECLELEFRVATDEDLLSDLGHADIVYTNLTLEKNEYLFCVSLNGKPIN